MSTSTPTSTLTPDELCEIYNEEIRIDEERYKASRAHLVNPCSPEESARIMRALATQCRARLRDSSMQDRFIEWFNLRSTRMRLRHCEGAIAVDK